ncbi:MAG: serine hydrolase domain-containing protein [Chitinophagales bacterium]
MKKFIKVFFLFIFILLAICTGYAIISGKTYLFKAVWYNFAGINDYKIFSNDTVHTSLAQPWALSGNYNKINAPHDLDSLLKELRTIAVVVIKNDSLLYEKYWDGYSDSSWSGSFSIAKSITSLLVGAAIKEGKIKSVDELVSNYLPEFNEGLAAKLKIKDLLTMSSGSNWDEAYANPLSVTTEAYYGSNLEKTAMGVKIKKEPGTYQDYKSGDTELLGLIVEKVTGKSLSQYASEKLWQPLGAEHPALWSKDSKNGVNKAFCCFNSNARDFARIGQLMVDSGRWKGNAIIDLNYYVQSVTPCKIPEPSGLPCVDYGYQWWISPSDSHIFYARGILGQYIIVIPSKKVVIVRLGHKRSDLRVNGLREEVNSLINWGLSL